MAPAPFPQAGQGCFCQLITADRHMWRVPLQSKASEFIKDPWNAVETLDVSCPAPAQYAPTWSLPATGSGYDTPVQVLAWPANDGGGNARTKATAVDSFRTWVLYRPPSVDGRPTTWIPMARYTWHWSGTAELQGGVWKLTASSGGSDALIKPYTIFPNWDKWSPSPFGMKAK